MHFHYHTITRAVDKEMHVQICKQNVEEMLWYYYKYIYVLTTNKINTNSSWIAKPSVLIIQLTDLMVTTKIQ